VLVGSLGKIARDIALLTQSEIGELAEPAPPGRGGSSSMPQKRNPIGCAAILAIATRLPGLVSTMLAAMPQEHERALGGWLAEWETLPEILQLTAGALAQLRQILGGLQVNTERMRVNLEVTGGQIYAESVSTALAKKIGHAAAHQVIERACRKAMEERRHLRDVVTGDSDITTHLPAAELAALFDPGQHIRAAARRVDHALASDSVRRSLSATEGKPCPSPK
jgi:3-carboxy-cis,cis-muconate cycloisomerase